MTKYVSPYNLENLRKLAEGLLTVPEERFDMSEFIWLPDEPDVNVNTETNSVPTNICGTAACALGWAPQILEPLRPGEWFDDFGARVLLEDSACDRIDQHWNLLWEACFAGRWANIDNSPQAASRRIYDFVAQEKARELSGD